MTTMKRSGKAFLVLMGAGLFAAGAAAAQNVAPDAVGASTVADARQRMERADALLAGGQAKEARDVLQALAQEQQAAGVSAAASLIRLAAVHQSRGNLTSAASAFDEAAEEAEKFAETPLQVRALMQAGEAYTKLRVFTKAQMRAERVQLILSNLTEAQRAAVDAAIQG